MATYEQMGDFQVLNVGGKLQKNGGNVASYFCTPEGRVIHAVGKPVQPEVLLREAKWALDTFEKAKQASPTDVAKQMRAVEDSHLAALGSDHERFIGLAREEWSRANEDYQREWRAERDRRANRSQYTSYSLPSILRVSTEVTARRRAANRLGGDQAHRILAAQPLAPLNQIETRLFEKLTGEKANEQRGPIYTAGEKLKKAKENNLPVLFVFYEGRGTNKNDYDSSMQRLVDNVFRLPQVSVPLQSYAVIPLPIRQIPALSNVAEVPAFELPSGSRPALILANSDVEIVAKLPGNVAANTLASYLWPAVHTSWIARGKQLSKDGEHANAMRLLRKVQIQTKDTETRQAAIQTINDVNMAMAGEWAERGNKTGALRLWTEVKLSAVRDDVRQKADEMIAQLRSSF